MNEAELFEQARIYLPKYLSPSKQKELWDELRAFPGHVNYYSTDGTLAGELLQGDGWRGFIAINFRTLERKRLSGLILSNSCDINVGNPRAFPPDILFAPLVKLSRYTALLSSAGQSPAQIESVCDSIRSQRATSIFYVPAIAGVLDESIAMLGVVHSHPLDDFIAASDRAKLFTLSQTAFYLFLVKLSIHFTRMQEEVSR